MSKLDLKKAFPKLYKSSSDEIDVLTIPEMKFYMIDGEGDPDTNDDFKKAIECLYAVSFKLKMGFVKKEDKTKDYVIPPLEGLWYMDDMSHWSMENKTNWQWTLMIRIPDFVKEIHIQRALEVTKTTKKNNLIDRLYFDTYQENDVVQLMHIGPYSEESPKITKLHEFIVQSGWKLNGKHHEIYLSDPRKSSPKKMKTILRQPFTKNS